MSLPPSRFLGLTGPSASLVKRLLRSRPQTGKRHARRLTPLWCTMKSCLRPLEWTRRAVPERRRCFRVFARHSETFPKARCFPRAGAKIFVDRQAVCRISPAKLARCSIAAKAAGDPLLVEGIWRTQAQSHTSFEPHAAVAQFNGEHLTVYLSTQAVHEHAKLIAEKYGLPPENVRVIADHVGGGFGSRERCAPRPSPRSSSPVPRMHQCASCWIATRSSA